MDRHELRHRLNELSSTLRWLRTLTPNGVRYKLWLGDLVEFVGEAFGAESPQMARIRAILRESPRVPADTDETERTRAYLARLDAFHDVLSDFARGLRDPLILIEPGENGHTHHE